MPSVGVASNGYLYIDWSEIHFEIEIEFANASVVNASRVHRDTDDDNEEIEDNISIETLSKWVNELSENQPKAEDKNWLTQIDQVIKIIQTRSKIQNYRNFHPFSEDFAQVA